MKSVDPFPSGVLAQRLVYRDRAPQNLPEDQQGMEDRSFVDEEDGHALDDSYGDAEPADARPLRSV